MLRKLQSIISFVKRSDDLKRYNDTISIDYKTAKAIIKLIKIISKYKK